MDKFFDFLGDILKSFLDGSSEASGKRRKAQFSDPDMQNAWSELDDFLNEDENRHAQDKREKRRGFEPFKEHRREALRQDYVNLEVSYGVSFEQVKKSYRRLLRFYHPDRNTDDPEKLRMATEITKKINVSFQRIEIFEESN